MCLMRSRWNQDVKSIHTMRWNTHLPVLRCWAGSWKWWRIQTSCAPRWWSRFSWVSTSSWTWLPPRWSDSTGTCAHSLQVVVWREKNKKWIAQMTSASAPTPTGGLNSDSSSWKEHPECSPLIYTCWGGGNVLISTFSPHTWWYNF